MLVAERAARELTDSEAQRLCDVGKVSPNAFIALCWQRRKLHDFSAIRAEKKMKGSVHKAHAMR